MLSKIQIKDIQSLQLKKNRDQRRLFIAEGVKTVSEILKFRPQLIKTIFATADFLKLQMLNLNSSNVSFVEVKQEELQRISLQSSPGGSLAVCHYFKDSDWKEGVQAPLSFFLDDIRDPGNFGTIMRLLAWFGHQVLYVSPSSCEMYNPKVIQASMGTFLRLRVIYTDLPQLISERKFEKVYGAVLNGKSIFAEPITSGLIVIGNEANGINEAHLSLLTDKITIPAGHSTGAESLNAAMAASIIAAEAFRQQL